MHRGYIKLWRCCQDNELWLSEPFTKSQAWVDLIFLANWEDGSFVKRGVRFEVKRGMLAWSIKGLADRWGWSRHKVVNFLNMLEKGHQIEHQKNTITTLITIINYDKYQDKDTKRDIKRTSKGHQKDTSKESKALQESKEVKDIAKKSNGKFKKPSLEEVKEYCLERRNNIDPEYFIDSNEAKGWKVGKTLTPMKCWKATIRTWEKNDGNNRGSNKKGFMDARGSGTDWLK